MWGLFFLGVMGVIIILDNIGDIVDKIVETAERHIR